MTWLYIPSNSAQASECSAKASAPHSSYLASATEPFATWSGKPLLPANLPRLWKRERSIRRLSGLTCSHSTAQLGADAWISSLRASRAKTSVLLDGALGLTESAPASSSTCSTLPTIAVRSGSFWRTSQASLLPPPPLWTKPKALSKKERPPASWENWPNAGGMRSGSLFRRPKWAPVTGALDGSASPGAAWPTPDVCSGSRDLSKLDPERQKRPGTKITIGIAAAAENWTAPASRDYRTPNSQESQESRNHAGGEQLPNFLGHNFLHPALSTIDGRELSPTAQTLPRRLNPAFACWLMGWPIWWTNPALTSCARSAMALYRSRLLSRLSSCCGAQASVLT